MMRSRSSCRSLLLVCGLLAGTLLVGAATNARALRPPVAGGDSTVIVLLGTGVPRPDPAASGPATAIILGTRVFLFDAGPGVMRRMNAAKLPITGPTATFITHLHSDHPVGYPDLIFTTWVAGRSRSLEVFGPHGLQSMTDHIIAAWSDDIDIRTNGLEHESKNGYSVHVHEISAGVVYDSAGVKITAIPVLHGSWKEAYGYRIDTPDRSIVISGDTRPSPAIEQAARGVDVLIHEVHPDSVPIPPNRSADWPQYQHEFHTSASELGRLAAAAMPKLLVLYHFGARETVADEVVASIRRQGYQGRLIVGKDLDRF
ncbi:MAG: MBL fold metallo-hydrolase [Gemmatimonas sp.]